MYISYTININSYIYLKKNYRKFVRLKDKIDQMFRYRKNRIARIAQLDIYI